MWRRKYKIKVFLKKEIYAFKFKKSRKKGYRFFYELKESIKNHYLIFKFMNI